MGQGTKVSMPIVALAALLLALGLVACGSDDESDSATTGAVPQERPEGQVDGDDSASGGARTEAQRSGEEPGSNRPAGDTSDSFTPKPHDDSGGGAKQFRIPGGDNSVQEFGEEGEGAEFERAAAALHGFYDARAQKAWTAACTYLAEELVTSLEQTAAQTGQGMGTSCAAALELSTNTAAIKQLRKEAAEVDVGSLRAEGDRGFLLYRYAMGTIFAIPMVREDGGWKVASLSGIPLT